MPLEREQLLPLAEEGFDLAEVSFPVVNSPGCVRVHSNAYSVPLATSTKVEARVRPARVEVWHEGRCVAGHERCYGRQREVLELGHYLDVLTHKPGAFAGSKPLEQWRKLGKWPRSYDRFWEGLMERHGRQQGTREMLELLRLGRVYGPPRLREVAERALGLGCGDVEAVRHLPMAAELTHTVPEVLEVGELSCSERPLPVVTEYDEPLVGEGP